MIMNFNGTRKSCILPQITKPSKRQIRQSIWKKEMEKFACMSFIPRQLVVLLRHKAEGEKHAVKCTVNIYVWEWDWKRVVN